MVLLDRLGDVLQHDRLTHARRGDDQAALALAERGDDVDHPARAVLQRRVLDFHVQALFGIERRQVVEQDLGLDHLRIFEVDRVDLEQGEVALALARTAHSAVHRVARAQTEAADLRRRDIDVVRTRQIVGVGAAQEAEAVRQNLQHARGDDLDLFVGQGLQDGEQQVLLTQVAGVLDVQTLGEGDQVFRRLLVQFLQGDAAVGDDRLAVLVLVVGRGVDARVVVDDLSDRLDLDFGLRRGLDGCARAAQRQRLARTFRNNFNGFGGLVVVFRRVGHGVLARALGRERRRGRFVCRCRGLAARGRATGSRRIDPAGVARREGPPCGLGRTVHPQRNHE